MRRALAAALLSLFVLQSSGAAMAAPPSLTRNTPSLLAEIRLDFGRAYDAFSNTQIGAFFTGQESHYSTMHAPPPVPLRDVKTLVTPEQTRISRGVRPVFHSGRFVATRMVRAIDIRTTPLDPLAMSHGGNRLTPPHPLPSRNPLPMLQFPGQPPARTSPMRSSMRSFPLQLSVQSVTRGSALKPMIVNGTPGDNHGAGINPWWTYEEGAIPGAGKWMVNVATGNLIVQDEDLDVPGRGIDLAFQRTYNSQSRHDYGNSDSSVMSNYGNGWTNTFDAHLAYDATSNILSVYDIDGARYDFTSDGNGHWIAPPGMQGTTLLWDGSCGYLWTKKSGTRYHFYSYKYGTCSGTGDDGYDGRLDEIVGRNHNNSIEFTYTWQLVNGSPDATSGQYLASIVALHADGQKLTLTFGEFSGLTELAAVTGPDSLSVQFDYDSNGNLTDVCDIGNGNTDSSPNAATVCGDTTHQHHRYYYANGYLMYWADGPRWTMNWGAKQPDGSGGGWVAFNYVAGSNDVANQVQDNGYMNFTPNDGTGSQLQSGINTAAFAVWTGNFYYAYDATNCPVGQTCFTDTDGHSSLWFYNTVGNVTQTEHWTGSVWLTSYADWDSNNDLTATLDPRSSGPTDTTYQTNYAYDANGNVVAMALPPNPSGYRPTSLYSYATGAPADLVAYCDPVFTHSKSLDWTGSGPTPTDTLCPDETGATRYGWLIGLTDEPYGCLTQILTPAYGSGSSTDPGNETNITYGSSGICGNNGLPTEVQGVQITQNDKSTRTPTQSFVYNDRGDLTCYSKNGGTQWWRLTYDDYGRQTAVSDPDDASMQGTVSCPNSAGPGISGSTIVNTTTYYPNGDIESTQSPSENAIGVSTTYTYDDDGDELSKVTHYTCTTSSCTGGTTQNWYDGLDRLIEVKQPQDSAHDIYGFAWMTRYIYDVTVGGTVSISGGPSNVKAYGNLYKTRECLNGNTVTVPGAAAPPPLTMPTVNGPCGFEDVRGNTFDALDRSLGKYEVAVGSAAESSNAYDGGGNAGLLYQKTTGTRQTDTLAYDADGNVTSEIFNDGTANRTYTYDADSRAVSLATTSVGTQTRTYDDDGQVATATAPSSLLNGATITYAYYADGLRAALSLKVPSESNFNQNNLFTYDYRADGLRNSLNVTDGSLTGTFAWVYTQAGREQTQSDPDTGDSVPGTIHGVNVTLGAKTYTYDAAGQVSGLTLPVAANVYSSMSHDAEGELLGANVSTSPSSISYSYTARGEVTGSAGSQGYMANGASCQQIPIQYTTGSCVLDARSDAITSITSTEKTTVSTHAYTYDAAGRMSSDTSDWCGYYPNEKSVRTYNADSHIVQQTMPAQYDPSTPNCYSSPGPAFAYQTTNTYVWGADGHLAQGVSSYVNNGTWTTTMDYQWDGDDALYYTQSDNGADDGMVIYIEKLGYISGGVFGVYDRDWTGTSAQTHSTKGFTGWSPDSLQAIRTGEFCQRFGINCPGSGTPQYIAPPLLGLSPVRSDGYGDAVNVFQGVRAYDPNASQWTAPDAYAGAVRDPVSQKPYVWNRNNPLTFGDPSGFDTQISSSLASTVSEMESNSTLFSAFMSTLNADKSHTYVFTETDPAKSGYPGFAGLFHAVKVDGKWDGRTIAVDVKPGLTKQEKMHVLGHETSHAMDYSASPTDFNLAQGSQTLCAPSDPHCNDEEARAQQEGNTIDEQLGLDPTKFGQYKVENQGDFDTSSGSESNSSENAQPLFVDESQMM